MTTVFSQINPFAQYVVRDIFEENEEKKDEPIWHLHESTFKRPDHEVNPENLKKSSSQMFTVYKYYENPSLQVKSPYYKQSDEYMQVGDLAPKFKFFHAPGIEATE